MGSVTGFTASRMLAMDNASIVDGNIVGNDLILYTRAGTPINLGNVRGSDGDPASAVTELGSAIDLNSITTIGYFSQSSDVEASGGTNYPVPKAGMLYVIKNNVSPSMIWQTYTVYNGGPYAASIWVRAYYNGVWGSWVGHGGGAWTNLSFASSVWSAYGGAYRVPSYKVEGSWVKLRGLCRTTAIVNGFSTIANLTDFPPIGQEIFSVSVQVNVTSSASSAANTGGASAGTAHTHTMAHTHTVPSYAIRLDVSTAGAISVVASSTSPLPSGAYLSLAGIQWDWKD